MTYGSRIFSGISLVVAFAVLAHLPLLVFGYPHGHDAAYHLKWLYHFSTQLHAGDFYPRWLAGMSGGLGGPGFYYYPPAAYYLMAQIAWIVDPWAYGHYVLASGAFLIALIGSGATYWFCRPYLGQRSSLFAAILFLVMPYRILVDLYMRGDIAELASISVLPFVFLVRTHCDRRPWRVFMVTVLSTGLIVLTHPLVALIILPFSGLFRLLDAWRSDRPLFYTVLYGIAMATGLALSAFYILPATQVVNPASGGWDLFVVYDSFLFQRPLSTSRVSAILGWGVIVATIVMALFFWAIQVVTRVRKQWLARFFLAATIVCSLMLFPVSEPVYHLFPMLERLQFPWRYTTALTLFALLGCAFSYSQLKHAEPGTTGRLQSALIVGLVVVLLALALVVGVERESRRFTPEFNERNLAVSYDAPEYRLSALAARLAEDDSTIVSRVSGIGDNSYVINEWSENKIVLDGSFTAGMRLTLGRQYFGLWAPEKGDSDVTVSDVDGLVTVDVVQDTDRIALDREEFSAVVLGNRLSRWALVILLIGPLLLLRQRDA